MSIFLKVANNKVYLFAAKKYLYQDAIKFMNTAREIEFTMLEDTYLNRILAYLNCV